MLLDYCLFYVGRNYQLLVHVVMYMTRQQRQQLEMHIQVLKRCAYCYGFKAIIFKNCA